MTGEKPTELSYNAHMPLSQALLMPRIAIEDTMPTLDGGQFAVKAVVGREVVVTSKVFADGHDKLAVQVRWRAEGEEIWQRESMKDIGNNGWRGQFTVHTQGRYVFCIEAWIDQFASFCYELQKKHMAAVPVSLELQEGRNMVQHAAERADGPLSEALAALHHELAGLLETEQVALFLQPRSADLMAQADHRPYLSFSQEFPLDVERELAEFASWYELFPRSITDDPARHGTFNDVHSRLPMIQDMGFDVLYFPPIHPIGRSFRKGPNNSLTAGPDDPGSPYAIGSPEGGHEAIHPQLGTRDDFRRLVAAARAHGLKSPWTSPFSAPRTTPGCSNTRDGSTGGRTAPSNTPRTRPRNTRTSSTSTSMPPMQSRACGPSCATLWWAGSRRASRSSESTTPTPSPYRFGSG